MALQNVMVTAEVEEMWGKFGILFSAYGVA